MNCSLPGSSVHGMGNLSLLQGIFPTQGSNRGLPHRRQILPSLSHLGSTLTWKTVLKYKTGLKWSCLWLDKKPRLNYSFGSPKNGVLNQSIRTCLISTSQVRLDRPLPSPKGKQLCNNESAFLLSMTPLFLLPSHLTAPWSSFLYARLDAAPLKLIFAQIYSWKFLTCLGFSCNNSKQNNLHTKKIL